jgi:hypothetical protein
LPNSFTRTINAGGKLYSLPHRRPIFFMVRAPLDVLRDCLACC